MKHKNLIISDFFDDAKLHCLKHIEFDFIIGNPPWGSVSEGMHMQYCKDNGHINKQQNKEICKSFVFRSKDFSSANTICSFILHSKILYTRKSPSQEFRKYLLCNTKILDIVEMSSVRKLVFKNAKAPAIILTFNYNETNSNLKNRITYTSMKPNMFFKLFNIIVVEKYDVKYVQQNLLFENDWAWKTIVYGFSSDIDNVIYLKNNFNTLKKFIKQNNFNFGVGIEDQTGDKKDATHLLDMQFLQSSNSLIPFYVDSNNTKIFNSSKIHRPKSKDLFLSPFLITSTGVDCKNYKMRAAYSEVSFISKKTMYIIKGSITQKKELHSIVAMLNSSLYSYLNLMLGSSIGIEREQRFMNEVLDFPYTYNDKISRQSENITACISNQHQNHLNEIEYDNIENEIKKLDILILKIFNLHNNLFVDYTLNIQIPELTNSKALDIYRKINAIDLSKYAKCFINQFSYIYNKHGKGVHVKFYQQVLKRFVVFELEIVDDSENKDIIYDTPTSDNIKIFTQIIRHDYNEMFYQIKDIIHFTENSFYIIKPNNYKYWHPAIAEMDLSDVLDQILSDDGGV